MHGSCVLYVPNGICQLWRTSHSASCHEATFEPSRHLFFSVCVCVRVLVIPVHTVCWLKRMGISQVKGPLGCGFAIVCLSNLLVELAGDLWFSRGLVSWSGLSFNVSAESTQRFSKTIRNRVDRLDPCDADPPPRPRWPGAASDGGRRECHAIHGKVFGSPHFSPPPPAFVREKQSNYYGSLTLQETTTRSQRASFSCKVAGRFVCKGGGGVGGGGKAGR